MPLGLLATVALASTLAAAGPDAPPVDTLLDVGGHRLHFVVHRGSVPVTIVLEAGGGASLAAWAGLDAELASRTGATVVAYERAGFGASEVGPAELTAAQQVAHLAAALERLGVPRERVLVGHSYGGLMALLHAAAHAKDVRGLVLVDAMNPRFVDATGDFVYSTVPHIEAPANDVERAVARMVRTFDDVLDAVRRAEPGVSAPVVVITAGESVWDRPDVDEAWRASHAAMAAGPGRRLIVADGADHDIPAERPDLIVEAVGALVGGGS